MYLQWSLTVLSQNHLKTRLRRQRSFQVEKHDFTVKWKNVVLLSEIPLFSRSATGSNKERGKMFLASIYSGWYWGSKASDSQRNFKCL